MPKTRLYLFLFVFILAILGYIVIEDKEPEESDFRIENEVKLNVDVALVDSVWNYLVVEYSASQNTLSQSRLVLEVSFDIDHLEDTYFDDNELTLQHNLHTLRLRKYYDKKALEEISIDEVMQFKADKKRPEERKEIEFKIQRTEEKSSRDIGLLLKLIHEDEHEQFEDLLHQYEYDAEELMPLLKLKQDRRRVEVTENNDTYITLSLDNVTVIHDSLGVTFAELEVELNEKMYTKADKDYRIQMEKLRDVIVKDVQKRFGSLKVLSKPKYNRAIELLQELEPDFPIDNDLFGQ